ncbi:hypothetical protein [Nesterenkonia lutea]|uniref:Uncharacterized protein n=1 Tax=Nesterenkonia lutea TaxID=272919 RepID=A0ABR9JCM5_9MICC|nr:hypothetical protein [Nesterenkonia lutea]MBE1523528.1 hypothetical protein [Nesterenkonia lutea]
MRLLLLISRTAGIVAAVLAVVAAVAAAAAVPSTPTEALVSELWRCVGLITWAALFVLLAARPQLLALWVIALSSKIALVVVGLAIGLGTPGAGDLVLWDGILSLVLAVGSVACIRVRTLERPATSAQPPMRE